MKDAMDVHRAPRLARDERGQLFDERVREFVGSLDGAAALEAIAAVRAAARALHLIHERWADRQGLSDGRLQLLISLGRCDEDGVSLGRLADLQHVTPRNITGLVDNLERAGLVERVPVSGDRRSIHARLTPAGRERIDSIRLPAMKLQFRLAAGFMDDELVQLRHLSLKLLANAEQLAED
jgi:DNA-binding MarR family transcriptional regulator